MKNWKNWVLPALGTIALILDMGFDVINPLLLELEVPAKSIGVIKAFFGVYAIWKMANNKALQRIGGGGIRNPDPK